MERFWSSSLGSPPLELNRGFIPSSPCGSSTGVCSWGCPRGLRSAQWGSGIEVVWRPGSRAPWLCQVRREAIGHWWRRYGSILVPGSCCSKDLPGWSFYVAQPSRHSKGSPGWGPSVLLSPAGAQRTTLSGVFLHWSAACWPLSGVCGKRGVSDGSSPCVWLSSSALSSWLPGVPPKALPAMDFFSPIPSGCLPAVNSSPRPRIALQSPLSSSHPLLLPVDSHSCPGYVGPRRGSAVWFSLHWYYHRLAALLSDSFKCFPSVPMECPGFRDLPPASAPPSLAADWSCSLSSSSSLRLSYQVCMDRYIPLGWSGTSAQWEILHLKIYSQCIHRERCTLPSCRPTPPLYCRPPV